MSSTTISSIVQEADETDREDIAREAAVALPEAGYSAGIGRHRLERIRGVVNIAFPHYPIAG